MRTAAFLKAPFANPFCDSSDARLGRGEIKIIKRLAASDRLVQQNQNLGVGWYWDEHPKYPAEYGVTVTKLISRGIVRPVTCAGGYTEMVLTDAAKVVLGVQP